MSPGTATGGLIFLLICLQEAFKHLKLIAACMNTLAAGQIANAENDWKWKVSWMVTTGLEPAAPAPSRWSDIYNNLA